MQIYSLLTQEVELVDDENQVDFIGLNVGYPINIKAIKGTWEFEFILPNNGCHMGDGSFKQPHVNNFFYPSTNLTPAEVFWTCFSDVILFDLMSKIGF